MCVMISTIETVSAVTVLFLLCVAIIGMIAFGIKLAADARIEEVQKNVDRLADRKARELMRERLDGLQIVVTQRISVIEDDLKGGKPWTIDDKNAY